MDEVTISPKALEEAMIKALPTLFPHLLGTANNARVEFYDKFQREADEYDRDFIKKYDEDLNTTLIFAGLFSAVASAFIIDVESQLQPDYTQFSYNVLAIIANISLGHPPADLNAALPQWTVPPATIVDVQAILYSSLAASLLSAFAAMLGKQWLNQYSRVEMRGSIIDRSRDRQRKMNGMVTWRFDLVMECLPLMLQAALLLLGYALSTYLFTLDNKIAGVTVAFTGFGLLFYLLIVSAATLSYNCPFQTPLSLIIRFMIRFDDEHRKYIKRTKKWFEVTFLPFRKKKRPRLSPGGACPLGNPSAFDGRSIGDHTELAILGATEQQAPLFNKETDWHGYVLDSNCIAWLFEMSMDADVLLAIMKFIPEVVWHVGIRSTPLQTFYDIVLECFDGSSGRLVVITKLRDKAYLSAKALLHLAIQRKSLGCEMDDEVLKSISSRHRIIGWKHYDGDPDLESTLSIIDRVFGDSEEILWDSFSFSIPHHSWMGHILLYRAWDAHRRGAALPDDVQGFVVHSLRKEPPPPAPIAVDCLFIVGLLLGIGLHVDDLVVIDKSPQLIQQIDRIYDKLAETFLSTNPTADDIDRALQAMALIAPFSQDQIATKSYHLFRVIMQAPISFSFSQEKKWEAARLAVHGAYKWDKFLPWVDDPQDILVFLDHHFDLATRGGEDQDEPIQNALRALAYASNAVTTEALNRFNPTEPSFIRGICYVYQKEELFQLRKAALFLLPLIGDRWFNTPNPIMEPDQMRDLCVDWASAVDSIEHTEEVQRAALAVLFGMINSPHWRPHIVTEKWGLLHYFTSLPDDFPPLRRCLDNLELTDVISEVDNPEAVTAWLTILWLRYGELMPEVREKLEMATKVIAQSDRRTDLDLYLTVMDSELTRVEDLLAQYHTRFMDPAAAALRTKKGHLEQARVSLFALKRDPR